MSDAPRDMQYFLVGCSNPPRHPQKVTRWEDSESGALHACHADHAQSASVSLHCMGTANKSAAFESLRAGNS